MQESKRSKRGSGSNSVDMNAKSLKKQMPESAKMKRKTLYTKQKERRESKQNSRRSSIEKVVRSQVHSPNDILHGDSSSSSLEEQHNRGIFRMPLKKMPSIINEIFDNMSESRLKAHRKNIYNNTSIGSIVIDGAAGQIKNEFIAKAVQHPEIGSQQDNFSLKQPEQPRVVLISKFKPEKLGDESDLADDTPVDTPADQEVKEEDTYDYQEISAKLQENLKAFSQNNSKTKHKKRGSLEFHQNIPDKYTAETIATILTRPQKERTGQDNEEIHHYMMKHVKFFHELSGSEFEQDHMQQVTKQDKLKLYEVLMYKVYAKNDILCEFGSVGDRFYIILQGEVSVRQPKDVELVFDTTWDLFNHILNKFEQIHAVRDQNSRECYSLIGLLSTGLLRSLNFVDVKKFDQFLFRVAQQDVETYDMHPTLNRNKLTAEKQRLLTFMQKLRDQTIRKKTDKDRIVCKISMMQQVAVLRSGDSFGQDSLIAVKTRNATCIVISENLISAVLTKNDFQRVLADNERIKIDSKVSQIQQSELFRHVSKRKLKNIFRMFYDPATQEPYMAHRNQYLYRQGDPVSGIFCILSGELNRIKEIWDLQDKDAPNKLHRDQNTSLRDTLPENKSQSIAIIKKLKRNKAQQILLTIVQKGETLGVKEVVSKAQTYQHSIQVASNEPCTYLFISAKNFQEKLYHGSIVMKKMVHDRLDQYEKFHSQLETNKTSFTKRNSEATEIIALTIAQEKEAAQGKLKTARTSTEKIQDIAGSYSNRNLSLNKQKQSSPAKQYSPNRALGMAPQSSASRNDFFYKQKIGSPDKILDVVALNSNPPGAIQMKNSEQTFYLKSDKELKDKSPYLSANKKIQTQVDRLDKMIDAEIQKARPNVKSMIQQMKNLRKEKALIKKEKRNQDSFKMKDFSSKSGAGKILEQEQCKRFVAHYVDDGTHKYQRSDTKLSLEKIQNQLIKDADGIYSVWKNERLHDEQTNLVLASLTDDKRIQRILGVFSGKLAHFVSFLKSKGTRYIRKLGVPCFEGSVLLQPPQKDNLTRKEGLTNINSAQNVFIKEGTVQSRTNIPSKQSSSVRYDPNLITQKNSSLKQIKSLTLQLQVSRQGSSSRGVRDPYFHKSSVSGGTQTDSGLLESKEPKLDLMNAFYEWFQSFQMNELQIQNDSAQHRKSADQIAERAKIVGQKLFESANSLQKSHNLPKEEEQSRAAIRINDFSLAKNLLISKSLQQEKTITQSLPLQSHAQNEERALDQKLAQRIHGQVNHSIKSLKISQTSSIANVETKRFKATRVKFEPIRQSVSLNVNDLQNKGLHDTIPEEEVQRITWISQGSVQTPTSERQDIPNLKEWQQKSNANQINDQYGLNSITSSWNQNIADKKQIYKVRNPLSPSQTLQDIVKEQNVATQYPQSTRALTRQQLFQKTGPTDEVDVHSSAKVCFELKNLNRAPTQEDSRQKIVPLVDPLKVPFANDTPQIEYLDMQQSINLNLNPRVINQFKTTQSHTISVLERNQEDLTSNKNKAEKGTFQSASGLIEDSIVSIQERLERHALFLKKSDKPYALQTSHEDYQFQQSQSPTNMFQMSQNIQSDTTSQVLDGQIYVEAVKAPESSLDTKKDKVLQTHKKSAGKMTEISRQETDTQTIGTSLTIKQFQSMGKMRSGLSYDFQTARLQSITAEKRFEENHNRVSKRGLKLVYDQKKRAPSHNQWVSPFELRKKEVPLRKERIIAERFEEMPIPQLYSLEQYQPTNQYPPETVPLTGRSSAAAISNFKRIQKLMMHQQRSLRSLRVSKDIKETGVLHSYRSAPFLPKTKILNSKQDTRFQQATKQKSREESPKVHTNSAVDIADKDNHHIIQTYDNFLPTFKYNPQQVKQGFHIPPATYYGSPSPLIIQAAGASIPQQNIEQMPAIQILPSQRVRKTKAAYLKKSVDKQLHVESQEYIRFTDRVIQNNSQAQQNASKMRQLKASLISETQPLLLSQPSQKGIQVQARLLNGKYTQSKIGQNHYSTDTLNSRDGSRVRQDIQRIEHSRNENFKSIAHLSKIQVGESINFNVFDLKPQYNKHR